ncbi:MAG: glycine reductase [Hyphomicrobiaceae bacterium]
MTHDRNSEFGFAPAHDAPIPYLARIRAYYAALGYGAPYEWAHYADVPFQPLSKPLAHSRVGLITTAAPYQPDKGDQGPRAPYNAAAKFYEVYDGDASRDPDLRISHVAIDRAHTTAEDQRAYFPLPALRQAAATRRIGEVAPRFFGLPTNRSHRHTLGVDCPALLARCREDKLDAAILVPNCPVCHQSVSLAARHLEAAGLATVIMGAAKDIVEYVGVPRLLFSDVPLGNSAGRPHDTASQKATLALALDILEHAPSARTTVQSPLRWSENPDWRLDYCNIERLPADEIARRRAEFDRGKAVAAGLRSRVPARDETSS